MKLKKNVFSCATTIIKLIMFVMSRNISCYFVNTLYNFMVDNIAFTFDLSFYPQAVKTV